MSTWDMRGVCHLTRKVKGKVLHGIATLEGKIIVPVDYKISQIEFHNETIVLTVGDKRYFYNTKGEPVSDCYINKGIGERQYPIMFDY